MARSLLLALAIVVTAHHHITAMDEGNFKIPPPSGSLSSYDGGPLGEQAPPIYKPASQSLVLKQLLDLPNTMTSKWEKEQDTSPDNKNCLVCEEQDSGSCRNIPSCVYCETTATALCERDAPCMRCTVIKNPFFKCIPGEKYMDECNSCRCMDGHSGWCTNQFCEFSALYVYAIKISDAEYY